MIEIDNHLVHSSDLLVKKCDNIRKVYKNKENPKRSSSTEIVEKLLLNKKEENPLAPLYDKFSLIYHKQVELKE
jgi:hypothetical protein